MSFVFSDFSCLAIFGNQLTMAMQTFFPPNRKNLSNDIYKRCINNEAINFFFIYSALCGNNAVISNSSGVKKFSKSHGNHFTEKNAFGMAPKDRLFFPVLFVQISFNVIHGDDV